MGRLFLNQRIVGAGDPEASHSSSKGTPGTLRTIVDGTFVS